jgi:hypothetical protein
LKTIKSVYASIGNSDDKLTQYRWNLFTRAFKLVMNMHSRKLHGVWYSESGSEFQNMCICAEVYPEKMDALRKDLSRICGRFEQESIAMVVTDSTEFIVPNMVCE